MSDSTKAFFEHPLCVWGDGWAGDVLGCMQPTAKREFSAIIAAKS